MTDRIPRRPGFVHDPGVNVHGWSAYALSRLVEVLLREHEGGIDHALRAAGIRPGDPSHHVDDLLDELRGAAGAYAGRLATEARGSAPGTAEPPLAEPGAPCDEDETTVSSKEAAGMLGVTDRMVRKLATDGRLGRRVGRSWRFTHAELLAEADRRVA